jgi:hypothetical protein
MQTFDTHVPYKKVACKGNYIISFNVKRNLDQSMMCVQSLTHEIYQIEWEGHQGYRISKSKRLSTICLSTIYIAAL